MGRGRGILVEKKKRKEQADSGEKELFFFFVLLFKGRDLSIKKGCVFGKADVRREK